MQFQITSLYSNSITKLSRFFTGAIFDWEDKVAKTGFLFAISNFNKNENETFRLSAILDVIHIKDSFNLATSSKSGTIVYLLSIKL